MKKVSRFLKNEKYNEILWNDERNICHNVTNDGWNKRN